MYAIVDIAGQQFKVEKDSKVFAHRLEGKEGSKVTFDKVLLLDDNGKVSVGVPTIDGATVSATIVSQLKDDKVIVFKKKRRKGYQKQNGHRQALTELLIEGISAKGGAAKAEKKEAAPKAEAKTDKKTDEISENLVTRAEHRAEDANIDVNVDKVLHHIGTALKEDKQDLTQISGIGPVFEEKLNTIGIYTYEQISKLKASDKENLSHLSGITADKINDEDWVKQAKALMKDSDNK